VYLCHLYHCDVPISIADIEAIFVVGMPYPARKIPVLAHYTCTRLGEICALQASDAKQIEGVATLEINGEARRRRKKFKCCA